MYVRFPSFSVNIMVMEQSTGSLLDDRCNHCWVSLIFVHKSHATRKN